MGGDRRGSNARRLGRGRILLGSVSDDEGLKGEMDVVPLVLGDVSIVRSSFMLLMSYRYIWSSSTTTNLLRFSRTASTVVRNVSSQIVECL